MANQNNTDSLPICWRKKKPERQGEAKIIIFSSPISARAQYWQRPNKEYCKASLTSRLGGYGRYSTPELTGRDWMVWTFQKVTWNWRMFGVFTRGTTGGRLIPTACVVGTTV